MSTEREARLREDDQAREHERAKRGALAGPSRKKDTEPVVVDPRWYDMD